MEQVDLINQHPINSAYNSLMDTDAESVRKASRLDPDWEKRHARSIEEGVRFKSQLRDGLEKESNIHRERMLSDVMDGVISGSKNPFENFRPQAQTNTSQTNFLSRLNPANWGKPSRNTTATHDEEMIDSPESSAPVPEDPEVETTPVQEAESRQIGARTIYGLLNALAEEVEGLHVEVDADPNTPFWRKHVSSLSIFFTRLGTRQMRFGGLDEVLSELEESLTPSEKFKLARNFFRVGKPTSADEAFDRIDVDGSGALDEEELAQALKMAAILGGNKFGIRSKKTISELASRLVRLYDTNGDGVVDREEYQVMVKDMAALRDAQKSDEIVRGAVESDGERNTGKFPPLFRGKDGSTQTNSTAIEGDNILDVSNDEHLWSSLDKGEGSIVFEDLLVDLRQLLFGSIPGVKRILPGGPLILQPFTCTVTASWDRDDIMNSFLIDSGLRRLVARALSRRVRGLRDLLDGAVFYGRTWKLFAKNAPLVEVPKLDNVEFDNRNRLIITGRAIIKDALSLNTEPVEQGFKLRTKIGTRNDGRIIGLLRPEIAIFAQCPEDIEKRARAVFKDWFSYTLPTFQPLYSYIPLVSPLKKDDKMDGFNLGEDNQIRSIDIRNGKLVFEMSAFLRPGRFLGNHYIAFTVPNRTLILTVDKVKEGMKNARKNKRLAELAAREVRRLARKKNKKDGGDIDVVLESNTGQVMISPAGKVRIQRLEEELQATIEEAMILREFDDVPEGNFFSRFVQGYSGAMNEELDLETNSKLGLSIADFFGAQENDKR